MSSSAWTKEDIIDQCLGILKTSRGRLIDYSQKHYGTPMFDTDTYGYCLSQQTTLWRFIDLHRNDEEPLSRGALNDVHQDCLALMSEVETLTRPHVKSANKT